MKVSHAAALMLLALSASGASAQTTRSRSDTVTAYGARLLNPADTSNSLNARRINNRINNRIENRISTRIERYRVGSTASPTEIYEQAALPAPTESYQRAEAANQQGGE